MVLSPPTQSACAPRATSELTASTTAELLSTFASSSVTPRRAQASRAFDREGGRVGLGRIPRDAHPLQAGERSAREIEGVADRQERALADHVRRVLHRIAAIEPDAGAEGIGDEAEDVPGPAVAIRVRHRLHRRRAGREHQVELAGGDLSRDGVAGRQVALRVVGREPDRRAVAEAALGEAVDHAAHALVQDGRRGVLHDRDAEHMCAGCGPLAAIGEQQDRRGDDDQRDAKGKASERPTRFARRRGAPAGRIVVGGQAPMARISCHWGLAP